MAEKEYIEREALLSDIGETVIFTVRGDAKLPTAEMRGANKVIDRLKSATAADVVEVVRCKDCAYANERGTTCHYGVGHYTSPMRYCSEGERKDGADNEVD